jgi:hypothetical protein
VERVILLLAHQDQVNPDGSDKPPPPLDILCSDGIAVMTALSDRAANFFTVLYVPESPRGSG